VVVVHVGGWGTQSSTLKTVSQSECTCLAEKQLLGVVRQCDFNRTRDATANVLLHVHELRERGMIDELSRVVVTSLPYTTESPGPYQTNTKT
jgi:hypothetical protein